VTAILRHLDGFRRHEAFGQLVRFGIAGGISTVIYAAVYMPLVTWVLPRALWVLANVPAFFVAAACGFFLHSVWSFRDHGTRDPSGRQHVKFLVVQGAGLLLNMAFTWVLTSPLGLPNWSPLLPAVFVTPLVTFAFNRHWVFA
jgi:putative flippase GtrA